MTVPANGFYQPVLFQEPLITPLIYQLLMPNVLNTPIQGPDFAVPLGHALIVRPDPSIAPDVTMIVANAQAELAKYGAGTAGAAVMRYLRSTAVPFRTYIQNANQLWFMSDNATGYRLVLYVE